MASELHVDAIKHSGGTSALTIDSSGRVNIPGYVVQVSTVSDFTSSETTINNTSTSLVNINVTRKVAGSAFLVRYECVIVRSATSNWHYLGYNIGGSNIASIKAKDDNSWHTMGKTFALNTGVSGDVGATINFASYNLNGASHNDQIFMPNLIVMEIAQ